MWIISSENVAHLATKVDVMTTKVAILTTSQTSTKPYILGFARDFSEELLYYINRNSFDALICHYLVRALLS